MSKPSVEKMDELDINWISGNVQVERYDGDTIKITEADSKNLSEEFPETSIMIFRPAGSAFSIAIFFSSCDFPQSQTHQKRS